MVATLVTEANSEFFLPAVSTEDLVNSDFFLGVYDEETDTACGVLAAETIEDHTIAIRSLYVDGEWRGRGAGRTLVETLLELSYDMGAGSVVCAHSRPNESDGIAELLEACHFIHDEEEDSPIFSVRVGDCLRISKPGHEEKKGYGSFTALDEITEEKWQKLAFLWNEAGGNENGFFALLWPKDRYLGSCSYIAFDEKGRPEALLLMIEVDGGLKLDVFTCLKRFSPSGMVSLSKRGIETIIKEKGEDERVIISTVSKNSYKLLEEISEGAKLQVGATVLYTYDFR